jgi:acetate kinase
MGNLVFVLNCGSSSVKFCLMDPLTQELYFKGQSENIGSVSCTFSVGKKKMQIPSENYSQVLERVVEMIKPYEEELCAIGHRVVHGGQEFTSSVVVDDEVLSKIRKYSHLAPLHNPVNAFGIEMFHTLIPHLPNIAVFDTSFHMSLPKKAFLYPLPFEYYKKHQIRKYGFHGTSHRFVSHAAKTLFSPHERLVIAHLGNGCSVCAVKGGKSVDTSMGFTPLEGLMMGTRCGDIDPSIVLFLSDELSITSEEVLTILNKKSGLLGISGISSDMRTLEEKALMGDPLALLAIEMFCYHVAKYIASYLVPLGGMDGLIFTGGIGENSSLVRSKIVALLPDIEIDEHLNTVHQRGTRAVISQGGKTIVAIIPTNEELLIAQDAFALREKK